MYSTIGRLCLLRDTNWPDDHSGLTNTPQRVPASLAMRVVRGVGRLSVLGGRFRRAREGAKVSILLRAITPRRVPASPATRTSNVTSVVANALLAMWKPGVHGEEASRLY